MIDPTTPPADPTAPAEPDTDPVTWDPERAARTIKMQRQAEKQLRVENNWLRQSLQIVAAGRPLSATEQAAVDYVTPTPPAAPGAGDDPSTLAALAAIIGGDASDPAGIIEQAKQIRLSQELGDIFHDQHVEVSLARSAINDQRLLANIDMGASDLRNQLTNLVHDLVERHPQLRLRANGPATTIAPMPAGSGGSTPFITRESLKYLDAETVNKLRMSGQLEHLNVGKG